MKEIQEKKRRKRRSASDIYLGFLTGIVALLLALTVGELICGDRHAVWLLLVYTALLANLEGLKYLLK